MSEKEKALKLVKNTSESITELVGILKKLHSKLLNGELESKNGFSLLDLKNIMMLKYLGNLAIVMREKIAGNSIEGNPCIDSLVEYRIVLEKVKSLEAKTKYLVDKMIRVASTGALDANDPANFKANPANMIAAQDEAFESESENDNEEEKKTDDKKPGVYVPPKLAAVHYDDDRAETKRQKLIERAKKAALNSSVVSELREEYLDTPTEIRATNTLKQKEDLYQRKKQEYEETYFTRLPVTKEEKERAKRLSTLGKLGDELTRFEDISALEEVDSVLLRSKRKRGHMSKANKSKLKKEAQIKRKKFRRR